MAGPSTHEAGIWTTAVLGVAAAAVAIGLLTPQHAPAPITNHTPAPTPADQPAPTAAPVDPQPEVLIQNVVFTIDDPNTPEARALLERLGGPDPSLRGLTAADPTLDEIAIQQLIRGVPGAQPSAVMGTIQNGGQAAGIGVEMTTTDPVTGLDTGREQVIVESTVTVLEGGQLLVRSSLRTEQDTTALAVLGRRLGAPIGRTGQTEDALLLDPGQPAAIRLPGTRLTIVFQRITVRGG